MIKKPYCLLILSICFLTFSISKAQDHQKRFQKIEAAKVAYVTKELALTPDEAEHFFPIYNQYEKALHEIIRRKRDESERKTPNSPKPKRGELDYDADVLALRKQYRKQFAGIIGEGRASRYFEVEREFREQLFNQLKKNQGKDNPRDDR